MTPRATYRDELETLRRHIERLEESLRELGRRRDARHSANGTGPYARGAFQRAMYRLGQKVGRALRRSPEVRHENAIAQARARVAQLEKKLRMAGEPGDTPMVDVRGMSFLEPWAGISAERGAKLEAQLARELPRGHILDGRPSTAVAARGDQDDVLFEVPGLGYVVVHLSWSRGRATSAEWPRAQVYATLEQWRDRMKRDHEEFLP